MIDFFIGKYGELELGEENHIKTVTEDELRVQMAYCRIKSITHDWYIDNIGANLEKYLGYENTLSQAEEIKANILEAITFDEYIDKKDVFIVPKIIRHNISFVVFIKNIKTNSVSRIDVEIDIVGGVNITYDFDTQQDI